MEVESVIKCPECGFEKKETMPTDSCQYFYECTNCKKVLKPTPLTCNLIFIVLSRKKTQYLQQVTCSPQNHPCG